MLWANWIDIGGVGEALISSGMGGGLSPMISEATRAMIMNMSFSPATFIAVYPVIEGVMTGPGWVPGRPHELCYLGRQEDGGHFVLASMC